MSETKTTRPTEVECENCNKTVLPQDYLFEAEYCTFCKGEEQEQTAETIAAEALLAAADTVERWVDNEHDHYAGTDKTPSIGPEQTQRRAFNAALDYNVESDATGAKFDRVEDLFSEPIFMALKHDIKGKDAADFYRNQAKELLN